MSVQELAEISRFYGANPDYVIAGGGNTSFKDKDNLYIKASGTSLARAEPGDFVKMDRAALAKIWKKTYPSDPDARESAVLADMKAARVPGEEKKRPSVETLLHDILPFSFVVHTHPSLVNGLTCSQNGEEAAKELFKDDFIWIPSINPGYVLSKAVKDAMDKYRAEKGKAPGIIFLQNHGVFAGSDSVDGVKAVYKRIMETIGGRIKRQPRNCRPGPRFHFNHTLMKELISLAEKLNGSGPWFVRFLRNPEIKKFTASRGSFAPLSSAFTPDHIVYAGSDPFFADSPAGLEEALKAYMQKTGVFPKTIALKGIGVFGLASSDKAAKNAVELFNDAAKVAIYSESFGGPRFMPEDQIRFINNWEVERYRSSISR
ncbi:MAG: class II aldolase/adducin family protein [Treponema sp.]|nr:class II aldolase/adducin family protein [Treponema sp.]